MSTRSQRRTEIEVGATVLVALAILILGLAWLKEYSVTRGKRIWQVEFARTGGLSPSDEVQVNGLRKGEVRSMKLVGDRVIVELSLEKDITLTHDSQVAIRNIGMMGEKTIAVDLRTTGAPYSPNQVIQGSYEEDLGEVMGRLGNTVNQINELSTQLAEAARQLNQNGGLAKTLHNFDHTSEELRLTVAENRASLREAVQNFASASRTTRSLTTGRKEQLNETLNNVASAAERMDRLSGRLDSLRAVIQSVTGRVDRGEGTLGKLVQDDKLYADLNDSVHSLKALIEDIRAHPKKYLKISIF